MTSKEPSATAAGQSRETTEKVAGVWKEGLQNLADQATMIPTMPPGDLNQSVEQYFQLRLPRALVEVFVQRTVDLNRDLATSWAELVNTLTAERGLPKTGNVDDLIDRLVEADNK